LPIVRKSVVNAYFFGTYGIFFSSAPTPQNGRKTAYSGQLGQPFCATICATKLAASTLLPILQG